VLNVESGRVDSSVLVVASRVGPYNPLSPPTPARIPSHLPLTPSISSELSDHSSIESAWKSGFPTTLCRRFCTGTITSAKRGVW
jgi:hypothetical protein